MNDDAPREAASPAASADGAHVSQRSTLHSQPPPVGPPLVPDHELIRCIGRGAYGEVWLARHGRLGTLRAVKIVRRDHFEDARPFQREFDGIRRYEPISRGHPNLVAILHVGGTDDCFFYVMELADDANVGQASRLSRPTADAQSHAEIDRSANTLASPETGGTPVLLYQPRTLRSELKQHGSLPLDRCLEIAFALSGALAYLHARGLVHRDVKPSNVIFVGGVAKLADIGLVAAVSDSRSFVGTEGYIPPEGPGAPSADCYALGKLLYELSTGHDRTAWPEPPADLATRPDRARLLELNAILHKACAPDARARYANAEAMRTDLELLRRGSSVRRKQTMERYWALARRAALAAVLLASLLAAVRLGLNRFAASTLQRSSAPVEVNSIAVLPFANDNTYAPHEYLCDSLAIETINALTNCAGLRVASRPAVFAFKHVTNELREIGAQLGVRTVLAGNFSKSSNQLYVAARLLNVADGTELWSATYDRYRRSTNILEITSQVASNVARVLKLSLPDSALRQMKSNFARKLAAYRLFSQAITNAFNTQDGLDRSIQLLNQTIAEDPNHAAAYARLAYCYNEGSGFYLPHAQAMDQANVNALRALELDDSLPMAHRALAFVQCRHHLDIAQARVHFQRAIELAPNDGDSYGDYAWALSHFGFFDEAEQVLKSGEQVDPTSHNLLCGWCWRYYLERDFEKARQAANRLQTAHPNSVMGIWFLELATEGLHEYAEALVLTRQMMDIDPGPDDVARLGRVQARLGHREEALKALDELRVLSRTPRGTARLAAEVLVALGDYERAFEQLQRAVDDYPPIVLCLQPYPLWDDLRSDPRFQALLKKGGLEK